MARAILRKHGWAGYEPIAGEASMEVRTKAITWVAGDLRCCLDLGQGGLLSVTILDENRKPLGKGMIRGEGGELTDAQVTWEQGFDPADLEGQKVSLVFKAVAAKLYSFSFGPTQ